MARPQKEGLEYFPLDVDMDQEDKVALIEAKFGLLGFSILIKLLMKIYKEGYFYHWTEREQLLFSNRINADHNTVIEVVNEAIKWGFFSKELFDKYQILTSRGIQKRYVEAAKRRKEVTIIKEYLLVDITHLSDKQNLTVQIVSVNKNSENADNNLQNADDNPQSKVKESKVKESKVNNSSPKKIFGEYQHVKLTEEEYARLCTDYGGRANVDQAIKFLDEYIEEKAYKSKSHNLALRRWVFDAVDKHKGVKPNEHSRPPTEVQYGTTL